jgi:hypothetical protein
MKRINFVNGKLVAPNDRHMALIARVDISLLCCNAMFRDIFMEYTEYRRYLYYT